MSSTATLLDLAEGGLTIEAIDAYVQIGVTASIILSSQLGASLILLIILLVLTRPDKRATAVFGLNVLGLALNVVRSILELLYFTGPWFEFYTYFTGVYDNVPRSQYCISVASEVLTTMLIICVEASLWLQVRAVCATLSLTWKKLVLGFSALVALVVIVIHFWLMVQNAQAILDAKSFSGFYWLVATATYSFAGSVCYSSIIFLAKLAVAIKERRKLGIQQFGPMQIIFIMGCQTLILPAVFCIISNVSELSDIVDLASLVPTLVILLLPLSSLWASASINGSSWSSRNGSGVRHLLGNSGTSGQYSDKSSPRAIHPLNSLEGSTTMSLTPRMLSGGTAGKDLEAGTREIHIDQSVEVKNERH